MPNDYKLTVENDSALAERGDDQGFVKLHTI